jgi:hypothetical protein
MAGDLQHWNDLFSEGWKFVTGGAGGFVLGKVMDLRKWRKEGATKAKLREYGGQQATLYRSTLDRWQQLGGANGLNTVTYINTARAALEAAVKAYRKAEEEVNALELEKEARGWELLHALPAPPDPAEQRRKADVNAKLLAHAKEQETLYKHLRDKGQAMGGANSKDRTWAFRQAADHALQAAKAYREVGDVEQALRWEQTARNTVP